MPGLMPDQVVPALLGQATSPPAIQPQAMVSALQAPTQVSPDKFVELGQLQRGVPEQAMLKVQNAMGGGVLNPVVEHAGDLVHRMTNLSKYGNSGYEDVLPKVDKVLRALNHPYGFERELQENIKSNAQFAGINPEEFKNNVFSALKEFGSAHKALPSYNKAQDLAKQVNTSLGEGRFQEATIPLQKLKTMLETPETWQKAAFENLKLPVTRSGVSLAPVGELEIRTPGSGGGGHLGPPTLPPWE